MSSLRRPLMAGNWKMYKTVPEALALMDGLAQALPKLNAAEGPQVVVCPPYTALAAVANWIESSHSLIGLAAQNMESRPEGAYTGEVSSAMLCDIGARWVVLGHSERRQYYNETDSAVNAKTQAALAAGLTPIICVGETLEERESGATDAVVTRQVVAAIQAIAPTDFAKLVFAYEPVWAIGTGKVCDGDEANRVCGLIRQTLAKSGHADATRILYGGSVKPDNVDALMAKSDIDGALVGGASLDAASFARIVQGALQGVAV
jgi:triosephosphate isomerase